MATQFELSVAITPEAIAEQKAGELEDPQAYIFLGRDKFRTEKRTPQEWRKLFLAMVRMVKGGVSQNEFGLTIVYDRLEELEAQMNKSNPKEFKAALEKHYKDIDKEDAEALVKRQAKMQKKAEVEKASKAAVEAASKTKK